MTAMSGLVLRHYDCSGVGAGASETTEGGEICVSAIGKFTKNVVPRPFTLWTSICPWCSWIIWWAMANPVNPPPQLRIPDRFLGDRQAVAFFDQQRVILFQLWQKLGGNSDPLAELKNSNDQVFNAYTQQLTKRLDGLPQFTIDTSGFTTDTTLITTDKVIA